jgi:hypothetical protein
MEGLAHMVCHTFWDRFYKLHIYELYYLAVIGVLKDFVFTYIIYTGTYYGI